MLVELGFASLIVLAWRKATNKPKMTPKLSDNYLAALEHLSDPIALRKLATEYEKGGFKVEAEMLKKRAILRAMPKEKKDEFRAIAAHAMAKVDSNPEALEAMAEGFDRMTANGTARDLRRRAVERREEILAAADAAEKQRIVETEAAIAKSKEEEEKADDSQIPLPINKTIPSSTETSEESPAIHGE